MAKNYEADEQAFGVGDVAQIIGSNTKVRIVEVIQDENNEYWYTVEALNLEAPARLTTNELPQSALD